jgi:hypothetical protein
MNGDGMNYYIVRELVKGKLVDVASPDNNKLSFRNR